MKKFAVYGKGGIGKSTVTGHIAAAMSQLGQRVIQIGCDPKADSTLALRQGRPLKSVMDFYRDEDRPPRLEEISCVGYGGILCIETGGPTPGLGCAGRGIIATFNLLEEIGLFETFNPDVVLYDVLGDVVCGGFAVPIREGYAQEVLIVTSGEKMSLYAADNIWRAVTNFADRGYATARGLIWNERQVPHEREKIAEFAAAHQLPVLAHIPRSDDISRYEELGQTVIEGDISLSLSQTFLALARSLLNLPELPKNEGKA